MDHGGRWAEHLGCLILLNPHSPRNRGEHYPHFTEQETKALRGEDPA